MRVVTPEEMREIDARAIRDFGISEELLMERAGMAVSTVCQRHLSRDGKKSGQRILAVAGGGHNGADSLVALRDLVSLGFAGEALIAEDNQSRHSEALLREINRLRLMKVPIRLPGDPGVRHLLTHSSLIIDGILGTGFHGTLPESLIRLVEAINHSGASGIPIVSVDIPSGVDGHSGSVGQTAVRATSTVTFGAPKWGLLVNPGTRFVGDLLISRIGFPPSLLEGGARFYLTPDEVLGLLPKRFPDIHKGQAGHVLIAGGSPGKAGAVLLAAKGSLRLGSGLVTVLWDRNFAGFSSSIPEIMGQFIDHNAPSMDDVRAAINGKDAVGCGPGLSDDGFGRLVLETILSEFSGPIVADAGTFSIFAGYPEKVQELRKNRPLILTPHPGELARFLGTDTKSVLAHPLDLVSLASKKTGAIVLLKGSRTIVVDPQGSQYVNVTGHPIMAGPGMGDVLTGMIASLLGQGMDPFNATCTGAFIHGAAGERLGRNASRGRFSSELADVLPALLSEWEREEKMGPKGDPYPLRSFLGGAVGE